LISRWSRLAARVPGLVNFLTKAPVVSGLAKAIAGVAPQRRIPAYAPETFVHWFRRRPPALASEGRPQVVLWPDTFNNYFHPETARAAVEVLEHLGFAVVVPTEPVCCGRPLYDFGNLDEAERLLHQVLDALRPHLAAGTPIVGLEPSCVAVFRDELINLLPNDDEARKLSQSCLLLSEFLQKHTPDSQLPQVGGKALVHVHCHHKALMGSGAESAVLARLGIESQLLDDGCCGMAGAFGFEADHFEVSMKIGELVLLPAVRKADSQTMIVADGFSCREQIDQATDRRAIHLAEVIQRGLQRPSIG
jgi:Fe-S oxidoreductase